MKKYFIDKFPILCSVTAPKVHNKKGDTMTDIRIQWLGNRLTLLGLIVITWFSLTGKALEETAGLIAYPPWVTTIQPFRKRRRKKRNKKSRVISIWKLYPKVGFSYLWKTFPRMMIQSLVLFLFWVDRKSVV